MPLLYHTHGIDTVIQELRGEFAFIIYDQAKETIIAGRDPIGVRPLFL
ncbi:TPA: hypothetical protein DEP21_04450 [Patescibacteria group bacterium]|nr:hypothetical protein [Candidatus Gracilibacteria bacterium]